MGRPGALALLASISIAVGGACPGQAQQLEPRAYTNTPLGLDFLIGGYAHLRGAVLSDAGETLQDARVEANSLAASYIHSLGLWGRSGKAGFAVQYGCLSGRAQLQGETFQRALCGLADPRFFVSMNFYGAPALTPAAFASYHQNVIIGGRLQLQAPLGRYDPDRLLNISIHRWWLQPQLGVSKVWRRWTLELSGSVDLYSDNRDFFGGRTRAQSPLYAAQLHVIYSLGSGVWIAVSGTYYTGGRTTVDGQLIAKREGNARLGATLAFPLSERHSLKLVASTGVITRAGGDFDALGLAWQYRWGPR